MNKKIVKDYIAPMKTQFETMYDKGTLVEKAAAALLLEHEAPTKKECKMWYLLLDTAGLHVSDKAKGKTLKILRRYRKSKVIADTQFYWLGSLFLLLLTDTKAGCADDSL